MWSRWFQRQAIRESLLRGGIEKPWKKVLVVAFFVRKPTLAGCDSDSVFHDLWNLLIQAPSLGALPPFPQCPLHSFLGQPILVEQRKFLTCFSGSPAFRSVYSKNLQREWAPAGLKARRLVNVLARWMGQSYAVSGLVCGT